MSSSKLTHFTFFRIRAKYFTSGVSHNYLYVQYMTMDDNLTLVLLKVTRVAVISSVTTVETVVMASLNRNFNGSFPFLCRVNTWR